MRFARTELTVETAPREIREVTREVADWVARQDVERGLLNVFIPHTSASLLIQENLFAGRAARSRRVPGSARAGGPRALSP
jgi:thiamine phosphate synthase YjbQ (UPF0047 family)